MKGAIQFGIDEDGKAFFYSATDKYTTEVEPTEQEAVALAEILKAVDCPIKLYRRSGAYLTICNEAGRDFCRLKASSRVLWISIDMWSCSFENDPRLASVQNKNQRHWKVNLDLVKDIGLYADILKEAAK